MSPLGRVRNVLRNFAKWFPLGTREEVDFAVLYTKIAALDGVPPALHLQTVEAPTMPELQNSCS
jgi:hypothetical protein